MHALELSILLHRALEARVEYLMGLLGAPRWQEDPESLHQVRVASRRVRSVLELVRPELYPGFKRHGRKLRGLTRALGLSREMDVHAAYLDHLATKVPGLATGSALEHALEALEARRAKARKAMARDLDGNPFRHLPDLLKVPSLPDPFLPGDLASDVWKALDPLLEGAFSPLPGLLDQEDPPALHAARVRIKRLRYALEVLAEAFPRGADAQLRQLKELQTALGEHHDRVMLEALLQEIYQGLAQRNRKTLALGTLEVLAYVGDARLDGFERFRTVARDLPLAPFRASLLQGLGLPEESRP
jgi:CHAD domain-containing protein